MTLEAIASYLAVGLVLWLVSNKAYLSSTKFDPSTAFMAKVLTTATIILLWPLALGAVVVLILAQKNRAG